MRFEDFRLYTVRRVVRGLGPEFHTNDVARHPAMLAAHHPAPEELDSYLQMTGKYLHLHEAELGLLLLPDSATSRGRRWVKRGAERERRRRSGGAARSGADGSPPGGVGG